MEKQKIVEMIGGRDSLGSSLLLKYANVNKYSVFPKVHESNKGISRDQKTCYLCRSSIGGLVERKKCICNFCYNAVCQNCSPLKCNHPETLKEEKVCMQCYIFAIEDQVRKEVSVQVNSEFGADEQNKRIKETLKSEIFDYEEELKTLDTHLQKAHQELEALKLENSKKLDQKNLRIRDQKLKNEKEVEQIKEMIMKAKEEIRKKRKIITAQDQEAEDLRKKLIIQESKIEKFRREAEEEKRKEARFKKNCEIEEDFPEKEKLIQELNELKNAIAGFQKEQEEFRRKK